MVDGIPTFTLADIHPAAGTVFKRSVHHRRVFQFPCDLRVSTPASFPRRCADGVTGFRFGILVLDSCAADDAHAPPNKAPERNARWRWLVARFGRGLFHVVGRAWLSFIR